MTVYSQKIEYFYQENKETYEKLANSQKETIATQAKTIVVQEDSIGVLRALVERLGGK